MGESWLDILHRQVSYKGQATVAAELGISATTLSLVLRDRYPASTAAIERKVMALYGGEGGRVVCPILAAISPETCSDNWEKAKKIGIRAGNPDTMRLYKACLKCAIRNQSHKMSTIVDIA